MNKKNIKLPRYTLIFGDQIEARKVRNYLIEKKVSFESIGGYPNECPVLLKDNEWGYVFRGYNRIRNEIEMLIPVGFDYVKLILKEREKSQTVKI